MKKDVSPLTAIMVVVVALAVVWYTYVFVFNGKSHGFNHPPPATSQQAQH